MKKTVKLPRLTERRTLMDRRNYRPRYLFNDPVIRGEGGPVTTALMSIVKRKLRIGYEYDGLYVSMRVDKRWKINRQWEASVHASWARDKLFRFILWGKIFFMSCFEESDISSLKFKVYREARFIRREDVSLSPDFWFCLENIITIFAKFN